MSFLTTKEIRKTVWNHIRESAYKNGIRIDYINGYSDYYRCLIALDQDQSIEKMMEILKGEQTFWINKKGLSPEFSKIELPPIKNADANCNIDLREDCFTIVIGESEMKKVNSYILEQENNKINSNQKFDEYFIEYGFKKSNY
jgi:putative transposase